MAMYGYVFMAMYSHVCMAMYGYVWLCIYGYVWLCMPMYLWLVVYEILSAAGKISCKARYLILKCSNDLRSLCL